MHAQTAPQCSIFFGKQVAARRRRAEETRTRARRSGVYVRTLAYSLTGNLIRSTAGQCLHHIYIQMEIWSVGRPLLFLPQ